MTGWPWSPSIPGDASGHPPGSLVRGGRRSQPVGVCRDDLRDAGGATGALAFAVGFVVSQLLVCSAFVVLGVAVAGSGTRRHAGVEVVLEFAVALALLWLARRVRQSEPTMTGTPAIARAGCSNGSAVCSSPRLLLQVCCSGRCLPSGLCSLRSRPR